METKSDRKQKWLQAPRPSVDPNVFLKGFAGYPPPIDKNQDGHVDMKELMDAMVEAGATNEEENRILIQSYFDVLDPDDTGKVRTDVFGRTWVRMGQYRAIAYIKELLNTGEVHMLTKADGSRDCFFTKPEIQQAFEIQLGKSMAQKEVDSCFQLLDANNSSFMCSRELQNWYFSPQNVDLRHICLRLRMRTVNESNCYASEGVVLEQIETGIKELEAFCSGLSRKEKRAIKRNKGSMNALKLNRLVSRLYGVHDFLKQINLSRTDSKGMFDAVVSDAMMVPIQQAYKLGAFDVTAPPPAANSDDEED